MNDDTIPLGPDGRPLWYGRRHGHKLRTSLQNLVDSLLPKLRVPVPPAGDGIDPADLFDNAPNAFWLEIGFGGGEHLAGQAKAHNNVGFLGCEPYINGVATLLRAVDEDNLQNVRVFDDDVRILLDALPDAVFSRIYVLFPDPWPKVRHHRRRIIQTATLNAFARLLKNDGLFIFASDHKGYAEWTLDLATRHSDFLWTAKCADDWRTPPTDWIETRYEQKAIRKGDAPSYFVFQRRDRDSA